MATSILAGSLLNVGDHVWFDDQRDLQGQIIRKTDQRVLIRWRGGNDVWYPKHIMWELVK